MFGAEKKTNGKGTRVGLKQPQARGAKTGQAQVHHRIFVLRTGNTC